MEQVSNNLTMTDIILVQNIIEQCCKRGAFQPKEMKEAGELYNKVTKIVENKKNLLRGQILSKAPAHVQQALANETCTLSTVKEDKKEY